MKPFNAAYPPLYTDSLETQRAENPPKTSDEKRISMRKGKNAEGKEYCIEWLGGTVIVDAKSIGAEKRKDCWNVSRSY